MGIMRDEMRSMSAELRQILESQFQTARHREPSPDAERGRSTIYEEQSDADMLWGALLENLPLALPLADESCDKDFKLGLLDEICTIYSPFFTSWRIGNFFIQRNANTQLIGCDSYMSSPKDDQQGADEFLDVAPDFWT
jgi:hypothetical protein